MAVEQFQPGDVVQLKSGGPKMVISSINAGNAWCTWFPTASEKPVGQKFPLLTLAMA